jgi:hypothetical protein
MRSELCEACRAKTLPVRDTCCARRAPHGSPAFRVSALGDATAVNHTRLVLEKSAWPDRQAHAHYSHKADQSFQRKRYFKRTSIFLVLGQSTANTKLGEGGAVAQLIPAFDGDVSATSTLCSVGSCRGLVRLMRWLEAAIDEMVFVLHNHTLPARNVDTWTRSSFGKVHVLNSETFIFSRYKISH